ncbi:hypothetical protein ACF0H5_013910 [Mactra antiquata]
MSDIDNNDATITDDNKKPHVENNRGRKSDPMKFGALSKFGSFSNQKRMGSGNEVKKRKQATAVKIMAELGSESNAHGLAKIATSLTTKRKVMWSLLVIIGFTAATIQLSSLVKKFLQYQVVEVSNMKDGMPVEFPAVTVCNIAAVSIAKMDELVMRNSSFTDWFKFTEDIKFGNHQSRMESHQAFYENLPNEAKMIGHSVSSFIINCRFNNDDCGPSNFSLFFDGKNYYNCFTFNNGYDEEKDKPKDKKLLMHTTGPQNGLSLTISLDNANPIAGSYGVYNLKNHIAFSAGVRAQVHAPNTMPNPADHGFDVPPGYSTSVGLKAILHSRLPHPHGNCTFNNLKGDRDYRNTIFSCFQLCRQKILVKNCGCKTAALPMYHETDPIRQDVPFCGAIKNWRKHLVNTTHKTKVDLDLLDCEEKVLKNLNNDRSYEETCGCFQPCKETAYQKSLSFSYWPLELFQLSALQKFFRNRSMTNQILDAYERLNQTQTFYGPLAEQNIHVEYNDSDINNLIRASTLIRQNLIRLNIYLEDLSVVEFMQMPAYEIADLFADIGGTLGLWMGISVLTIMELIELIVSLIMLLCNSETTVSGENYNEEEKDDKNNMVDNTSTLLQNDPKYNHFQYDRPLFQNPHDRHVESPI